MSRRGAVSSEAIRFALADSITFLDANDWDRVSAGSGLFLSRRFLRLLEQNVPANLTTHYALAYSGDRPVAAIVAQSLDIRLADLSSLHPKEEGQGLWGSLGKATVRSITRRKKRFLLFGAHLPWVQFDGAGQEAEEPDSCISNVMMSTVNVEIVPNSLAVRNRNIFVNNGTLNAAVPSDRAVVQNDRVLDNAVTPDGHIATQYGTASHTT